ncbi:MAG: DUF6261 family protein [Alistipes sp.]|nr:DUF6261 family protein [Alistipes sp.]
MKIKNIDLTRSRNHEHFQFIQFVLELAEETGAAALKVEKPLAALAAAHAREDEALKKIVKSALTAEINDADAARDAIFRGLVNTVKADLTHFGEAHRKAATRLEIVLDTYGNAAAMSHMEETSAIYNLLVELTTRHTEDCETLGLMQWIAELDKRNVAVEKLLAGRANEGAERTQLVLKAVRAEVDDAYRALAEAVDALAKVDSLTGGAAAALYADFTRRLNERIDMVNDALAIRRGMAAAEKAEEEKKEAAAAGMGVEEWRAIKKAGAGAAKSGR